MVKVYRFLLIGLVPFLLLSCKNNDPDPDPDDVVYIAGGNLFAMDSATGRKKWEYTPNSSDWSFNSNSPTAADGIVYCAGRLGQKYNLYAIEAATGSLKWMAPDIGSSFASEKRTPVVANGLVYISGSNGLYAFEATTGTLRWKIYPGGNSRSGCPTINNGVVYLTSDDKCIALNAATGTQKWVFTLGSRYNYFPPVISNGVVFAGVGKTYAIDASTGNGQWVLAPTNGIYNPPMVVDGTGYLSDGSNTFFTIDPATGITKWSVPNVQILDQPSISKGVVYTTVINPNRIMAFNASDGNIKWEFQLPDYSFGSPTVSNGVVYVGNQQAGLYAINATTGEGKWVAQSLGGTNNSNPCVVTKSGKVVLPGIGN
jgi:outer membrane protein assembly factor BamB